MAENPDYDELPDYDEFPPDSPSMSDEDEMFKNDTEQVVKTFVYARLTSQIDKEATGGNLLVADIPPAVMNELKSVEQGNDADEVPRKKDDDNDDDAHHHHHHQSGAEHDHKIRDLGKSLADFGDEIQNKYHDTFTDMIGRMNISSEETFAYESFCRVAGKLFDQGINWGRIVALLCFGYEIAVHVIKQGHRGTIRFLRTIVRYLVAFIQKYASRWIAEQGGWANAMRSMNPDYWTIAKYTGGAAVLLLASYFFVRKMSDGS